MIPVWDDANKEGIKSSIGSVCKKNVYLLYKYRFASAFPSLIALGFRLIVFFPLIGLQSVRLFISTLSPMIQRDSRFPLISLDAFFVILVLRLSHSTHCCLPPPLPPFAATSYDAFASCSPPETFTVATILETCTRP